MAILEARGATQHLLSIIQSLTLTTLYLQRLEAVAAVAHIAVLEIAVGLVVKKVAQAAAHHSITGLKVV